MHLDWDKVEDSAVEYFENHSAEYKTCLDELDAIDNYRSEHSDGYERYGYSPMYDFDDSYRGESMLDVIKALDSDFDPDDDYFFEDYGTIYSTNDIEYDIDDDDLLDGYFVEALYDNMLYIDSLPSYIKKLFDAYDGDDEDEEDEEEDETPDKE